MTPSDELSAEAAGVVRGTQAGMLRRPRGRPADTDSEETRRGCLDAAIRAFADRGYSGTSTRAVAAAAGVTAGSLYYYFPSKAVLYRAAYEYGLELAYSEYERAVSGRAGLGEEVRAVLDCSLGIMQASPWITRLAVQATLDMSHPELAGVTLSMPARVQRFFESMFLRAVERGEVQEADRAEVQQLLALLLWGLSSVGLQDRQAAAVAVAAVKKLLDGRLLRQEDMSY